MQLTIEFFRVKNMEDSWFLSTPMSLNANTPTLETKETKTQRTLYIQVCLTATLHVFAHYIHQAIPAYIKKEEIGMLKNEIDTV